MSKSGFYEETSSFSLSPPQTLRGLNIADRSEMLDHSSGSRSRGIQLLSQSRSSGLSSDSDFLDVSLDLEQPAWIPFFTRNYPEVLELRERARPLFQAPSFGRNISTSAKTENSEVCNEDTVLQLIYSYLRHQGLEHSVLTLEQETNIKSTFHFEDEPEAMRILLAMGISNIKDLFNPVGPEPFSQNNNVSLFLDHEIVQIDSISYSSGLPQLSSDINIWFEMNNSFKIHDHKFIQGTFNQLLWWLILKNEAQGSLKDKEFNEVFLFCFDSLISSETLLNKLFQMYKPPNLLCVDSTTLQEVHNRIVQFLQSWMEERPEMWTDPLQKQLSVFLECMQEQKQLAKQLSNCLIKIQSPETPETNKESEQNYPPPKVPKNIFSPQLHLHQIDEEEIARQISLIDYNNYAKLMPIHFLNQAWARPELQGRVSTLLEMLNRSSALSRWVSSQLMQVSESTNRFVRVLDFQLKICQNLFRLQNFHALMAFYAGLHNTPIAQLLAHHWKHIGRNQQVLLRDLELLFETETGPHSYRELFSKASGPCIPFFGPHLRDLTFIEEWAPPPDQYQINFLKITSSFRIIKHILKHQKKPYIFHSVHQIAVLLSFDQSP